MSDMLTILKVVINKCDSYSSQLSSADQVYILNSTPKGATAQFIKD